MLDYIKPYKHKFKFVMFFWAICENNQMTPLAHCGAEDSVRLLLTKNTARFISCLWWQVHGISFERFP